MAKLKFHMKEFSQESFTATQRSWMKRTRGDIAFPTEANQILDWASTRLSLDAPTDSVALGVFKEGVDVASAICEIAITRKSAKSRWMKMLRVRLSPELELGVFEGSIDAMTDVQGVYIASVEGVLHLKMKHNATTLKIYGRSGEQLAFLRTLGVELGKKLKHHEVRLDGRWLVVENED